MKMTYRRVIPRDLFNEGNLLKCYGQLYLNLEVMGRQEQLEHQDRGNLGNVPFAINQDESDGSLTIDNIWLSAHGARYKFKRPLNSREPYPLYLVAEDDDIAVFEDNGALTLEFKTWLLNKPEE